MPRVVIIEDEPLSRMYLSNLLREHAPDATVVGTAATEDEALRVISELRPDVVFLDIELQTGSGFRVATHLEACDPSIIFTTALDEGAMTLLRLSGLAYIPKPIDADSVTRALADAQNKGDCDFYRIAIGHLRTAMANGGVPVCMYLPGGDSDLQFIPLADIIAIESKGGGCEIMMTDGRTLAARYELKELEALLKTFGFFRTHMQHIIQTKHLAPSLGISTDTLQMRSGLQVPLSPKKREALLRIISE